MPLNTNKVAGSDGPKVDPLDNGSYPGRVAAIIDLGLQPQRPYEGEAKPSKEEVMLSYELSDEFMPGEDGEEDESRPRMLSERFVVYSLKSEKAKSTARYKAIDPDNEKGGDFGQLIEMPVNITIVQNPKGERIYENVAGLTPMRPKEKEKLTGLVNPPRVFDLGDPDLEVFLHLYPWQQEIIRSNLNFQGSPLQKLLEKDPDYKDPDFSAPAEKDDDYDEDNPY